ncbi:MAG TPA: RNA 2',3'-cyclic phosphodiesterase [Candidatus Sulfotelmatobacter sp.]|nr:RNA 2',3'-cyclic phosphodiesterase [Candidatus Sulfotelmatobacter sp.]
MFIAVTLPAEVKKRIGELINELKKSDGNVKWVAEENVHLTLKFIGEVVEGQLAGLIARTEKQAGGTGRFTINLEGIGTFPAGHQPRVVWVGVGSGRDKLENLARSLAAPDFVAHATIGRIKDGKKGVDGLRGKLAGLGAPVFGEAPVDSFQIMKSTLTPQGPVYEIIKEVRL